MTAPAAPVEVQEPPSLELEDAPARLALAVGRLNRRLRPAKPELSPGMLMALSSIVRKGPLRPSELARIEGVSAPTATRVVVDLQKRGLVTRTIDPDDGRSFFVESTADGEEAILLARSERAEHALALLETLDEEERAAVIAALPALEKVSLALPT